MSNPDLQIDEEQKTKKYGGPYRKPRADAYTVMLMLTLFALIAGCVMLYFEMEAYDFEFKWEQPATIFPNYLLGLAQSNPMLSTDASTIAHHCTL